MIGAIAGNAGKGAAIGALGGAVISSSSCQSSDGSRTAGQDMARGAATGAVIGAISGNAGRGAAVGALLGGLRRRR